MITIFTIGYEKRSLPDLIDILQSRNVQKVIDVRQNPYSRRREFSRRALDTTLSETGVEYLSLPELGPPQPIRSEYRATRDLDRLLAEYLTYLKQQPELLDRVLELVEEKTCCLLCYERDYTECHRDVLTQQIKSAMENGVIINHL